MATGYIQTQRWTQRLTLARQVALCKGLKHLGMIALRDSNAAVADIDAQATALRTTSGA
jgi:hypothetical protein